MYKSQKNIFWQALVVTFFIFASGILIGYAIENYRVSSISDLYVESEIGLLDVRLTHEIFSLLEIDCEKAIEKNIEFGDEIYEEARLLSRYDDAQRLSENLRLQHKKYDLLRTMFWINSMKLKQKCNASYHNIIYIYDYIDPRLDIRAEQKVFSSLLLELKQKKGNEIMLIPIAGDNDLISISILMDKFDILEEDLPVVLIDEKIKITELETLEDLEKHIEQYT